MASQLTAMLEFEVGEFVYRRTASHSDSVRPRRFLITERYLQQCHGGIQKMYRLDPDEGQLLPEIALTRDEPPFRGPSKECIEARNRRWGCDSSP